MPCHGIKKSKQRIINKPIVFPFFFRAVPVPPFCLKKQASGGQLDMPGYLWLPDGTTLANHEAKRARKQQSHAGRCVRSRIEGKKMTAAANRPTKERPQVKMSRTKYVVTVGQQASASNKPVVLLCLCLPVCFACRKQQAASQGP